jgi:Tfp pilus assembly protein PilV
MNFSTKRWRIKSLSGFTIREVLLVVIIISVGLMAVIVTLTNGIKYVQKTRQRVIAINLAREWMEAIYQMRDTNRTRWAWVKDACRLKIDPLVDESNDGKCMNDTRFTTGSYVLQRLSTGGQMYFALTKRTWEQLNLDDSIESNSWFSLCQQSGYRYWCMWSESTTSEGKYFREIEWLGLYLKADQAISWWKPIYCPHGESTSCATNDAKEFRFCSKVAYIGEGVGEVKFCGAITNFKWWPLESAN